MRRAARLRRNTVEEIYYREIDWKKTGRNLEELRRTNQNLRRYVCWRLKYDAGNCAGDCENCQDEIDNLISQKELSQVFYLDNESRIVNWESGRSKPTISDLLYYADICKVDLVKDILRFVE